MRTKLLSIAILVLVVLVTVTPAFAQELVIPTPGPDPSAFPDELPDEVVYEQPLEPRLIPCPTDGTIAATVTNAERTISTCEQQPLIGTFTLPGNSVRFSTAALPVFLTLGDGWPLDTLECVPPEVAATLFADFQGWHLLYPDLCAVTNVRPYVVALYNLTDEPINLAVANGFGSFIGDAGLSLFSDWTPDLVRQVTDLHIKKMVFKSADAEAAWLEGNPYPDVNWASCEKVDVLLEVPTVTYCAAVNVVEGVWDGQSWHFTFGAYGTGDEGVTFEYIDVLPLIRVQQAEPAQAG